MRQQCVEPAEARNAVRVEERDQRRVRRGQAGVPGRRGPAVHGAAQHARARVGRDPRYRGRIARGVVDHDHSWHLDQAGQAASQLGLPVADRYYHRDVAGTAGAGLDLRAQHGMSDSGVEQAAGQRAGSGVVRNRRTGPPAGYVPGAGRRQAQHPHRGTADQHRSPGQ